MKFKNHYNAGEFPKRYEKNSGISLTVPNETMSMREILQRHARGLPVANVKMPIFEGDEDELAPELPDIERMDLAERETYAAILQEELNDIKSRLNKKAADIKEKKSQEIPFEDLPGNQSDNNTDPKV